MKGDAHLVLKVVAKTLLPLIFLFALYVQAHGELGPGGGFQAGVIVAVGVVLYALIFGAPAAMRAIPPGLTRIIAALGVLIYGGTGVYTMLQGGQFLDYQAIFGEPPGETSGQHFGIILVELGVLFTVAGSMTTVFYALAGRVAELRAEDW